MGNGDNKEVTSSRNRGRRRGLVVCGWQLALGKRDVDLGANRYNKMLPGGDDSTISRKLEGQKHYSR